MDLYPTSTQPGNTFLTSKYLKLFPKSNITFRPKSMILAQPSEHKPKLYNLMNLSKWRV